MVLVFSLTSPQNLDPICLKLSLVKSLANPISRLTLESQPSLVYYDKKSFQNCLQTFSQPLKIYRYYKSLLSGRKRHNSNGYFVNIDMCRRQSGTQSKLFGLSGVFSSSDPYLRDTFLISF